MDISILKDLGMASVKTGSGKVEDSTKGSIFAIMLQSVNQEKDRPTGLEAMIPFLNISAEDINLVNGAGEIEKVEENILEEDQGNMVKPSDEQEVPYEAILVTLVAFLQNLTDGASEIQIKAEAETFSINLDDTQMNKIVQDVKERLPNLELDDTEIKKLVEYTKDTIQNFVENENVPFEQILQEISQQIETLEMVDDHKNIKIEKVIQLVERINVKTVTTEIKNQKIGEMEPNAGTEEGVQDAVREVPISGRSTEGEAEEEGGTGEKQKHQDASIQDKMSIDHGQKEIKTDRIEIEENTNVNHYNIDRVVETISLTKQVNDNIKVFVTEGHSEIEIKLEPESLGKLSLKVVTEQGMMVAKFEAESQKVKEIIESNMNTLKRNLEEQGVKVQSLDVSVRQDSGGQSSQNFERDLRKNNNPHKNLRTDINKIVHSVEVNTSKSNVYKPRTSLKINYTA